MKFKISDSIGNGNRRDNTELRTMKNIQEMAALYKDKNFTRPVQILELGKYKEVIHGANWNKVLEVAIKMERMAKLESL
jgi:hypothetical protein